MNARQLSLVLLALNLGLLGVVVYLVVRGRSPGSGEVGTAGADRVVTNTVTQIAVRKINATNLLAALANRPLSWRMLESTNYFAYAQNLRNFGCPEETVRDIILTDVAKFYGERRRELRDKAPPPDFWRPSGHPDGKPGESPELRRQLAELDHEEDQLIADLLGVNRDAEMARYQRGDESSGPLLSFLPEARRPAVAEVQAKYAAMEDEVYARANGLLLDSDREALRRIVKAREAELAQVLSAEELLAYQLYNSETANQLRSQLAGFNASQEEFVRVFQLQKAYDDQFGQAFDLTDPAAMSLRSKAEQAAARAMEDELKRALGPQRYAEYQRAQDGDYRTLLQIADRYQLAPDVANNVYAMKAAAEQQKLQVETSPNLTDVQRAEALSRLAQETERNVASALGGTVFKDYQNGPGQWLNNLYFFDEENLPPEPEPAQARRTPPLPPLPPSVLNTLPPGYRELLINTPGALPPGALPPGALPPAPPNR